MTAVTENQLKNRSDDCRIPVPVVASIHLYENTLAFISSGGYATDTTNSGANRFGGIVVKETDNSSGASGDLKVELFIDGVFTLVGSGFAQTSVGLPVYATDNYTLTLTAAGNTLVGRITEYVDSTHVRVDIEVAAISPTIAGAYTQTYATTTKTVPAATAANVGTTAATTTTPWGFATSTQADAVGVAINATQADVLAVKKLVNAVIDDLQAAGIVG